MGDYTPLYLRPFCSPSPEIYNLSQKHPLIFMLIHPLEKRYSLMF
jgi:hypothetical protein